MNFFNNIFKFCWKNVCSFMFFFYLLHVFFSLYFLVLSFLTLFKFIFCRFRIRSPSSFPSNCSSRAWIPLPQNGLPLQFSQNYYSVFICHVAVSTIFSTIITPFSSRLYSGLPEEGRKGRTGSRRGRTLKEVSFKERSFFFNHILQFTISYCKL